MEDFETTNYGYTFDLQHSKAYGIWFIILLILIVILLIAIVWQLENVANDLKKKVLTPVQTSVKNIEDKANSTEARIQELGDRLQRWDQFLQDNLDQNTIATGKLALENLAFTMMPTCPPKKHHRNKKDC